MQQFWLFQATPERYKLINQVPRRLRDGDFWNATRYRNQMKTGDRVVLWQSGLEAGVYGFGKLKSEPEKARGGWLVHIGYEPLLRQPLFKKDLLKHPLLRHLAVIKMPRNTAYPVKESEWHALKQVILRDTINIFTKYSQEENRFTNGLVALLELSRQVGSSFVRSFLRELLKLEPNGGIRDFRVLRAIDGTADAELCGVDCCIRFETKIVSGELREGQVRDHLEHLERSPETHKTLVLLTPDDTDSNYIKQFLAGNCIKQFCAKGKKRNNVIHLEWRKVYKYLERHVGKRDTPLFSHLIEQFLKQIHDCIFEQDFAGIIQKIAFGDESEVYAKTTKKHASYLDDVKEYTSWNTPKKYDKLDGKGRKLLLYDPCRREITVEVEIAKVEEKKQRGKYSCRNSFVPKTLEIYPKPIPLSRITTIPGFHNFTRGMAAAWNVTREEYRQLRGLA